MNLDATLEQLRSAAENTPGLAAVKQMRQEAESISRYLASLHGDKFKVVVGLDFSFVSVMRDRSP